MYINFRRYSVDYDLENSKFSVFYDGKGEIIKDAALTEIISTRELQVSLSSYGKPTASVSYEFDRATMTISHSGAELMRQNASITFVLTKDGVEIGVYVDGSSRCKVEGLLRWGDHSQRETMAVNLKGSGRALRSAHGPAASIHDNTLFDKDTDSALSFETAGKFRMNYNWDVDSYGFEFNTMGWDFARTFKVHVEKDVYSRKFDIDYKKLNPNSTYRTPPVGWMTWYAVQFEAGEKTVLENTKWQAENLKKYGANTIWVDWEWYHPDHSSAAPDDVDMFHPNWRMYPNGLKYVADEIKKVGFIPALWIGPTCDPTENEMIKKYPDTVMIHKAMWSGQYFLDPTHPRFLDEILPRVIRQAQDWGYEAIKWDVLPLTTQFCDTCRDTRYDSAKSSREAMLGAFRKARELLGQNCYMLYCSGHTQRDMDLACCVFDAARIGGDLFRWDTFIEECVKKVFAYYPLHNVVCNNDPDNVIVREKFNNLDQAITRAAFVSLTGMPFTLGDDLTKLPDERVEVLRRSIPPVPANPMDVVSANNDGKSVIVNLAVERPDMRCNIVDVVNLDSEDSMIHVDFKSDLGVDDGEYYVYDYWNRKFIGRVSGSLAVELRPYASRIFAVHRVKDEPQVISTSRHISQGAMDIVSVKYDHQKQALVGESNVIGGEKYEIVVCADENMRIFHEGNHTTTSEYEHIGGNAWRLTFRPEHDGLFKWEIAFQPKAGSGLKKN